MLYRSLLLFLALALSLEANSATLHRVPASALPLKGMEGDLAGFKAGLQRQIAACLTQDLKETFQFDSRKVTRQRWCVDTGRQLLALASQAHSFPDLIQRALPRFEWYQSLGNDAVQFTGYYLPHLDAREAPDQTYTTPIYRQPPDLVATIENGATIWHRQLPDGALVPYYSREEIDGQGILRNQGLELAYSNDPFSVYILQVQGSGVLNIGGRRQMIGYAAKNGLPFVSLGHILQNQGIGSPYLSVPGMREYFSLHPEELRPDLLQCPSYVFFKPESDGPYGTAGTVLAPRQSIAVDPAYIPLGTAVFFQATRPVFNGADITSWKAFSTLALAQDTGSAILGAGHVDIYWGEDAYAEQAAGVSNQKGSLFLALAP